MVHFVASDAHNMRGRPLKTPALLTSSRNNSEKKSAWPFRENPMAAFEDAICRSSSDTDEVRFLAANGFCSSKFYFEGAVAIPATHSGCQAVRELRRGAA